MDGRSALACGSRSRSRSPADLRAGRNRLRVAVTNADASRRGEASVERMIEGRFDLWRYGWRGWYAPPYMGAIDRNGLIGPLRLIPFEDVSVDLDSAVT